MLFLLPVCLPRAGWRGLSSGFCSQPAPLPLISVMINLPPPGFLTKGLPRLKLLFDHTSSSFPTGLPPHHRPKALKALTVFFLIVQQWGGTRVVRPEDKGGGNRVPEVCASRFCYKCLSGSQQHPSIALCHTECRKVLCGYFVFSESSSLQNPDSCSQSKG